MPQQRPKRRPLRKRAESIVQCAVDQLHLGGVIAYPTEAVFGLGCEPRTESALQRIIDIKGRDAHKGFILIASHQTQLQDFMAPVSTSQQAQLDKHWPGPVTFVVTASSFVANTLLTGYRNTLAVRVSNHPVVVQLCQAYDGAIVSTSANRSGEPSLRTALDVRQRLGHDLDEIVDAPVGELASPTRIFDLASGKQLR